MGITEIFWIVFLILAIQPVLRQKMLEAARQRLIRRMERERKSRIILLVHRQESMSFFGIPIFRYIDINDSEEVIRAIHLTDEDVPIDLILHTPGGLVLASLQIAFAIKAHKAKVRVFVPHHAMSGGTLLALSSDEIIMDPHAVLGPVDPQIGEYPAASIVSAVKKKDVNEVDDRTLILNDIAEKALAQMKESVFELLFDRMRPEEARKLADALSQGKWTHDRPITCKEAKELGLPIRCDMPPEVYQLMNLFPQPVRHRATVEYIPEPRKWNKRQGGR